MDNTSEQIIIEKVEEVSTIFVKLNQHHTELMKDIQDKLHISKAAIIRRAIEWFWEKEVN